MAAFLYRVGRWAFVNRFKTIAIWVLVLIALGVGAALFSKPSSESLSIPGIPSEKAQDLMVERFPDTPKFGDDISITYVAKTPAGAHLTDERYSQVVSAMVDELKRVDNVKAAKVVNPLQLYGTQQQPGPAREKLIGFQEKTFGLTPEQAAAAVQAGSPVNPAATAVQFAASFDVDAAADVTDAMQSQMDKVADIGRDAGLTVEMKGTAARGFKLGMSSEAIGIGIGAVILILTFGSLVAWGMPIITAIVGVLIGVLGVAVARGFVDLSRETSVLATMIGLAVGIDYALFILSRYRHELHRTSSRADAAARAVGTAGSAVVFAGATVVIALAALAIVNIPFLTAMGIAAAATVVVAVLVALTLLPAVLGLFGTKAFAGRLGWLNPPDVTGDESGRVHNGQRYVRRVVAHPRIVTGVVMVVLLLLAIPLFGLKLALPNDGTDDPSKSSRKAYDLVAAEYGPGYNGPLVVVADGRGISDPAERIRAFATITDDVARTDGVTSAWIAADGINKAGDTAQISVIPTSAPDSDQTHDLVNNLRDMESEINSQTGVSYGVTGRTAIELDVSDRLSSSLLPYLLIVVGLAFVILVVVFRSIAVPLVAALGFLLSVAATFGVTVALFTDGWGGIVGNPQPLVSFLPIMLVGIVFGLAMDYQVFLVTRMREAYVHGETAKDAVVVGYRHGARVVAAAAAIMISVFAAFMLQDLQFIKVMGFALAIAVVFDAFVIRMTLMPAVLTLLGDKAWWLPRWLDRILPKVDIEGEALSTDHDDANPADKVGAGA